MITLTMEAQYHSEQMIEAKEGLQNKCQVLLLGKDGLRAQTETLWLLSPFVRSIIGSLSNIENNMILLPDYSSQDITAALDIIEGKQKAVLVFSRATKELLEILGLNLSQSQTNNNLSNEKIEESVHPSKMKRETVQDDSIHDNEDEKEIQKMLDLGFDSSYEEGETEAHTSRAKCLLLRSNNDTGELTDSVLCC